MLVVLNRLILVLNEWSLRDVNECVKLFKTFVFGLTNQNKYL